MFLFSSSGFTGLPLIFSIIINKICPPSNAGIGSKLINPTLILKKAIKYKILASPPLLCSPTIEYIPTGPDNWLTFTPPVNKEPTVTNICLNIEHVFW